MPETPALAALTDTQVLPARPAVTAADVTPDGSALVVSAGAARTGVDASAASRTNEATAVQRATAYPYRGGVTAIKR